MGFFLNNTGRQMVYSCEFFGCGDVPSGRATAGGDSIGIDSESRGVLAHEAQRLLVAPKLVVELGDDAGTRGAGVDLVRAAEHRQRHLDRVGHHGTPGAGWRGLNA